MSKYYPFLGDSSIDKVFAVWVNVECRRSRDDLAASNCSFWLRGSQFGARSSRGNVKSPSVHEFRYRYCAQGRGVRSTVPRNVLLLQLVESSLSYCASRHVCHIPAEEIRAVRHRVWAYISVYNAGHGASFCENLVQVEAWYLSCSQANPVPERALGISNVKHEWEASLVTLAELSSLVDVINNDLHLEIIWFSIHWMLGRVVKP